MLKVLFGLPYTDYDYEMAGRMQINLFENESFGNLSHFLVDKVLVPEGVAAFQELVYAYYHKHGRVFSWRQTNDPYHIVVSEIMLQQTQTERVKEKFEHFIIAFPSFKALSQASFAEVMFYWQGLGYNRRALALHKMAQQVMNEYGGILPQVPEILITFSGIGKATAASICAFAFNQPTIFIETNIRAVYIQTFFPHAVTVHDAEILPLVAATVDHNNARIWYYALMDYGVALKKEYKNPSRKSAHHTKQSRFEGSERQIRGMILKLLTEHKKMTWPEFVMHIQREELRIKNNLEALCNEGFIRCKRGLYTLM
jgi:A/G-specific adenine glycosylase